MGELSRKHLKSLFTAGLEFNSVGGIDRFIETLYRQVTSCLNPDTFIIRLGNDYILEKPLGGRSNISKDLFNHALQQGVSFIQKKSPKNKSLIVSPILDSNRTAIGAIYIEAPADKYTPQDGLFVRALAAQAAGLSSNEAPAQKAKKENDAETFTAEEVTLLGDYHNVLVTKSRISELAHEKAIIISGPLGTDKLTIAKNIHLKKQVPNQNARLMSESARAQRKQQCGMQNDRTKNTDSTNPGEG